MPQSTVLDMPPEEHAEMLAALRRARYGDLLALHIVLWWAAGRRPTDIAAVLCCARSSVYRTVRTSRAGALGWEHDAQGRLLPRGRTTARLPTLRRSLRALLKAPPQAYGWCRMRWSSATRALTLQAKRGITVSAETMRRWLHEVGWVWTRAKLVAKDDDPQRVSRLAHIRRGFEPHQCGEAMVCADALAIHLWPKVGAAWMPQGTPLAVMTPGQQQKHDLAGALELATGTRHHCLGPRNTNALFRDRLAVLDVQYPAECSTRLSGVVDHDKSHQAQAVEPWLAAHPRCTLLFLPTDCPRANPIERAFGDIHDGCTRNHRRQRLPDLVGDVADHIQLNGPRQYQLSQLSYEPMVTAALEKIAAEEQAKTAA